MDCKGRLQRYWQWSLPILALSASLYLKITSIDSFFIPWVVKLSGKEPRYYLSLIENNILQSRLFIAADRILGSVKTTHNTHL